jgi:DNA (cytosine-5)-methyltransferase 1
MARPRLLDLFSGAGGAAVGYHRAGFDVVGVDINPQPRYPFEFHQADAMTFPLTGFDAIHASPPCQDHSPLSGIAGKHGTGWMLAATIQRLRNFGVPWVVENVPGARMPGAFTLCGRAFGIVRLRRHRLFLTSFPMLVPPCGCHPSRQPIGVYGDLSKNDRVVRNSKDGIPRLRAGVQTARDLLDCQWMTGRELTQAIPPAYTQFIGEYLLEAVHAHA